MFRALDRKGLALPANYTGEVRQLARVRKKTFISPPTRRNRLWQADFSAAGDWVLGGVADYWAKVALACTVTIRKTADDAIAILTAGPAGWVEAHGRSIVASSQWSLFWSALTQDPPWMARLNQHD